jgi:hypothetical protein
MDGPCTNGIIGDVTGPCTAAGERLEASPSSPANGRNPVSPFKVGHRRMTHTIYGCAFILSRNAAVHSKHSNWSISLSTWAMGHWALYQNLKGHHVAVT